MNETQLERQLCDYLTMLCIDVFKVPRVGVYDQRSGSYRCSNNPYTKRSVGHSDLVMLYKGKSIYLEVKTPNGRQSDGQKKFQSMIEKNDGSYFIVKNTADIDTVIAKVKSESFEQTNFFE